MINTPKSILKEIGLQLDRDIFPQVKDGGIVTPNNAVGSKIIWAKETVHERQRKEGSKPGTWTWPEGRQGATGGPGSPGNATSVVGTDIQAQYAEELIAVCRAYPGTKAWQDADGLWIMHESLLLASLWPKAVFLTGIPFDRIRIVRSWGFWVGAPLRYPIWIGPRHTNSPDGSICAFEPTDDTWRLGDSLLVLLDIYTVWALRHLHLQVFQRWPGRQVAHFAYERLAELSASEHCGCGSNTAYEDCCQVKDLEGNLVLQAMEYFDRGGGYRTPPDAVKRFVNMQETPPRIKDVLPRIHI